MINDRVLLVDDELDVCSSLEYALTKKGIEVRTAFDGEKALGFFESEPFDLVITDLQMPYMGGIELIKRIRDIDNDQEIIVLTGFGTIDNALEAIRDNGASDFLTKPLKNIDYFTASVNRVLAKRKMRLRNNRLMEELRNKKNELEKANELLRKEIADRERAEEALKQSNEQYKSLYSMVRLMCDNMPDMIWAKDQEKQFIFANKAICENLLNSEDVEEPIGRQDMFFAERERAKHPENPHWHDFGEICADSDSIVLEEKEPRRFNEYGNVKGEFLYLDVHNAPFFDKAGELIGTVGCGRDVTNERRLEGEKAVLEKKLHRTQKMEALGTMAGGIAHDFNNILEIIVLNTEMAMMEVDAASDAQKNLKEIFKSSIRARDIVKQILTFSSKFENIRQPLSVAPVIEDSLKLLKSSVFSTVIINKNFIFQKDVISAAREQLEQVVVNLCSNAAYSIKEDGIIDLTLDNFTIEKEGSDEYPDSPAGEYLRLTVKDNGGGIEPENMKRIFDPYFTTRKIGEGSGLGLSVVLGVVQGHKGAITVKSEPGIGTTVQILFPLVQDEYTPEQINEIPIERGKEKVLFIDDEESLVEAVDPMLTNLGYRVVSSTDSLEALELFKNNPDSFDLVITDMVMPGKSGAVLAEEMKAIRPDIPIILCTGFSEDIDEESAKKIGIDAFVLKPISIRETSRIIRKVLDG